MQQPSDTLPPANPSEIEFADEGARLAWRKVKEYAKFPGSRQAHSAAHEYIDWVTIKYLGKHALPCSVTCDPQRISKLPPA